MECKELLKMLNDYIDGDIDPAICEHFDKHLEDCDPCQVVVDNIRKTIKLYKGDAEISLPEEFKSRLHNLLRDNWKNKQD